MAKENKLVGVRLSPEEYEWVTARRIAMQAADPTKPYSNADVIRETIKVTAKSGGGFGAITLNKLTDESERGDAA